jgi:hypothetical protein
VDAVRKVNLQTPPFPVLNHLVNRGRTEVLTRITVFVRAPGMTDVRLQDVQMTRLVFIMRRAGIVNVG